MNCKKGLFDVRSEPLKFTFCQPMGNKQLQTPHFNVSLIPEQHRWYLPVWGSSRSAIMQA